MKLLKKLAWFWLFCCVGCEVEENIRLEILVYDLEKVELQNQATVSIYKTLADWQNEEQPVVPTQKTDGDGTVIFTGLKSGEYFVDIKKDQFNNWEGKSTLSLRGNGGFSSFTVFFILETNRSSLLSAAKGKKWQLTDVKLNGESRWNQIPNCQKDDEYFFEKGAKNGRLRIENRQICDTESPQILGSWILNPRGNLLTMNYGGFSETWSIVSITQNALTLQQNFTGGVIENTYRSPSQ